MGSKRACQVFRGDTLFSMVSHKVRLDRGKWFVLDGVAGGRLTPVIVCSFALGDIVEAHRYLESNGRSAKSL